MSALAAAVTYAALGIGLLTAIERDRTRHRVWVRTMCGAAALFALSQLLR